MNMTVPQPLALEYPFKSHFFQTQSGHSLHYIDEGPKENTPIVMVHGNPTWSFFYRRLIRSLRPVTRCIALDHIGCGLSEKPANYAYTLQNHIHNLRGLIEHLELKKFHLVVHDWGGPIGLGAIQDCLNNVEKIVLMNTAAFPSKRLPWRIRICKIPGFDLLLMRAFNLFARMATRMATVNPLPKIVREGYLLPYRRGTGGNNRAVCRFVQDIPLNSKHPSFKTLLSITENLPQLANKDLLLFWGGQDFCFTEPFYKIWKTYFPAAIGHYMPDVGHYVLEDTSEAHFGKLLGFLLDNNH